MKKKKKKRVAAAKILRIYNIHVREKVIFFVQYQVPQYVMAVSMLYYISVCMAQAKIRILYGS